MKKRLSRLTKIFTLCSVLLSGCTIMAAEEQPKPELLKPVRKKVDLFEVKKGTISREINGVGVFVPAKMKFLQFTNSARLRAVNVQPGDRVKPGDVLLELDTNTSDGSLQLLIAQKKLEVAKAEAELEKAKKEMDPDKLKIETLDLQVAQLQQKSLEDRLAKRYMVSDTEGIVTFVDFLTPFSTIPSYKDIIGIADPRDMVIKYTTASSMELQGTKPGMDVEVNYKGKTYKGTVTQTPETAPHTDNAKQMQINQRSLLIKLDSMPPDAELGDSVEIKIVLERKDNVIVIPRVGLRTYQGRDYVHVMDGETRKEVDVERGLVTATDVEIRKGLKEGQKIILNN